MAFKDYFSVQATDYARFRPDYPQEMYDFILKHTPDRQLAWDCATGNGQVAAVLANHFEKVIATDASKSQIEAAIPKVNIRYSVAPAEHSGLDGHIADLITVGQALHWFDFDAFYNEAQRVGKVGALLVMIGYGNHHVNAAIDAVIQQYYYETIGAYWPKERKYIDDEYRTIPFPFVELKVPPMVMTKQWDLAAMMGYLYTWSATQQYLKAHGANPLELIEEKLLKAWGDPSTVYQVTWPLFIKAGVM